MSLGYIYIIPEPIGSARLTFDDDRYYGFMCFDILKVVRSPGCDHGHDEESRNGRDIRIDILDDYIWTPEWFRVRLGQYRSSGRLSGIWALMGFSGKEGKGAREPPQAQSELGGGPAPLSFLPPSSSFPLLLQVGKGGILLPVGVGLPLARLSLAGHLLPLAPIYMGVGGTP